jgi:hypothetical protein
MIGCDARHGANAQRCTQSGVEVTVAEYPLHCGEGWFSGAVTGGDVIDFVGIMQARGNFFDCCVLGYYQVESAGDEVDVRPREGDHRRQLSGPQNVPEDNSVSVIWNFFATFLRAGFEHQIEGCLGGASKSAEAAAGHQHLTQAVLARLSAKCGAISRKRHRHANLRRSSVHHSADRIQIVLNIVVRERLDDHCRAIILERASRVARRSDWIAHIVKAIEKCDQIK